ncbi:YndM family protein [Piscibacillus halophilus]|uniref:DUF2512 family protein n=1 Tax=Piscibacillus halophilus TaxID=571933 RepID=A0A1H9ILY9_9BACI|nr:YndM family protein [Piscibacillus halophilus]SEQ75623.1 Protein of unknown function [Piscibacillus halophilus]
MNHTKLLAIKFASCFVLLFLILGFGYDVSFGNVLMISVVLTLVSYMGDAFVLPRTSNTVATVTDFVLAYVVIYFMLSILTVGGNLFAASLISAVAVTIFEYFFHKQVQSEYNEGEREEHRGGDYRLQTEFSEELEPDEIETDENGDGPRNNRDL